VCCPMSGVALLALTLEYRSPTCANLFLPPRPSIKCKSPQKTHAPTTSPSCHTLPASKRDLPQPCPCVKRQQTLNNTTTTTPRTHAPMRPDGHRSPLSGKLPSPPRSPCGIDASLDLAVSPQRSMSLMPSENWRELTFETVSWSYDVENA
jgi:hypothetical protein